MDSHTMGEIQGLLTRVEERLSERDITESERCRLQRWRREMLLQIADSKAARWGD